MGNLPVINVKKKTLANGLRVLVYENNRLPIFSYYTFYDIGGRHESRVEKTTGATHFLEHMMFKGAKKYGPGQFDTLIEGKGGSTNAYTNFDMTVYYQNLPAEMLDTVVDMEADRIQHLLLVPESFESERNVIFEERKYRYENSSNGKLYLAMMQSVFEGTPYGGSVIGDEVDLKNLSRDQVFDFFQKYYVPNNAIIVVAGDVDADDVFSMVEKKFGAIPASAQLSSLRKNGDDATRFTLKAKFNKEIVLQGNTPVPLFTMAFKGEPLGVREAYVMDILSSILGSGNSSHLNQLYVKAAKPILNDVSVVNYNLKYNGVFYISGELLKGVSIDQIKQRLRRDMANWCDKDALNARNLQKTKNQLLVSYFEDIRSNSGMAHFLGLREAYFGDYQEYLKELEIYNSITLEEVKKSCDRILKKSNPHIFLSIWDKQTKSAKE